MLPRTGLGSRLRCCHPLPLGATLVGCGPKAFQCFLSAQALTPRLSLHTTTPIYHLKASPTHRGSQAWGWANEGCIPEIPGGHWFASSSNSDLPPPSPEASTQHQAMLPSPNLWLPLFPPSTRYRRFSSGQHVYSGTYTHTFFFLHFNTNEILAFHFQASLERPGYLVQDTASPPSALRSKEPRGCVSFSHVLWPLMRHVQGKGWVIDASVHLANDHADWRGVCGALLVSEGALHRRLSQPWAVVGGAALSVLGMKVRSYKECWLSFFSRYVWAPLEAGIGVSGDS